VFLKSLILNRLSFFFRGVQCSIFNPQSEILNPKEPPMPASPFAAPKTKPTMPRKTKSPRKGGGQPGNTNALKHGFYVRSFTQAEVDRLDSDVKGELHDEETLLRLYLARVADTLNDGQMNHDKYVIDLCAVSLAVGRIESLHCSRKVIYDQQTTLDKALEELKYIPPDED
jgi:hypothetical protein